MRRCAALQTCLGMFVALLSAPFQHVHGDADHHDAGVIHSHFYSVAYVSQHGPQFDDIDDDHASARSLDTFTLVLTAGLAPFIPMLASVPLYVPAAAFHPVEMVEERGHDPPVLDRSIPRAPPA